MYAATVSFLISMYQIIIELVLAQILWNIDHSFSIRLCVLLSCLVLQFLKLLLNNLILLVKQVVPSLNILSKFIRLDDGYLEINSAEFNNVIDF